MRKHIYILFAPLLFLCSCDPYGAEIDELKKEIEADNIACEKVKQDFVLMNGMYYYNTVDLSQIKLLFDNYYKVNRPICVLDRVGIVPYVNVEGALIIEIHNKHREPKEYQYEFSWKYEGGKWNKVLETSTVIRVRPRDLAYIVSVFDCSKADCLEFLWTACSTTDRKETIYLNYNTVEYERDRYVISWDERQQLDASNQLQLLLHSLKTKRERLNFLNRKAGNTVTEGHTTSNKKSEKKSEYFESDIDYVEGKQLLDVGGVYYSVYNFELYRAETNYQSSAEDLAYKLGDFILLDSRKYYIDDANSCIVDCSPSKEEEIESVTDENEISLSDSSNADIQLSSSGRYTGDGPCYIITVIVAKTEEEAIDNVAKLENEVSQRAGYLWIPDYESLSDAEFFTVFLGPFSTQEECEKATEEYRKLKSDALGLLVAHENKRVEIRGIGKVKTIEK